MISDLTPTIALIRREKRPAKTPIERARWCLDMTRRRLQDYTLRSDTRANLEREEVYWTNQLNRLKGEQHEQ